MSLPISFLSLTLLCLSFTQTAQTALTRPQLTALTRPQLTASTPTPLIDEPFTVTCTLATPISPTSNSTIDFHRYDQLIASCAFSAVSARPPEVHLLPVSNNSAIWVRSFYQNLTVFQVEIIPRTLGSAPYVCCYSHSRLTVKSAVLSVNTQPFHWPRPLFSTNTTQVTVGSPFTARCSMPANFTPANGAFHLDILQDSYFIYQVNFPKTDPFDSSAPRTPEILVNAHQLPYLQIHLVSYSLTSLEISITPQKAESHDYYCGNSEHSSSQIQVTALERPPLVNFSLNVTKPEVGVPFTASCAIANYKPAQVSKYTVGFYSKRDGRLATYETVNGTSLLLIEEHAGLGVHHGPRTAFPVFDLTLIESTDVRKAEYWCQLEMANLGTVSSTHWLQKPVVSFTSSKVNSTARLGTCSVSNFEPAGREYSVQFWTDLGPKTVNRLATFSVKPNQILEFLAEEVSPGWKSVRPGEAVSLPNFSIQATGSSTPTGAWWCLVGVGAQDSKEYREFKSSALTLA